MQSTVTTNHRWLSYLIVGICLIIILGYAIPETVAYIVDSPKSFQNTWDKVTYLSYQGMLSARSLVGYYPLYLFSLLTEFGIPGVLISLLADWIIPPLTLFFVYLSLRHLRLSKTYSLAYALIILFSSVMVNYVNPLTMKIFGPMDSWRTLIVGIESYPTILRLPNPQISYLLLSIFTYLTIRTKKAFYLLLPLPLLYYFVAVPYCYLLVVSFFIFHKPQRRSIILLVNLMTYLLAAGGVYLVFLLVMNDPAFTQNPILYRYTRELHYPYVSILLATIYILLKLTRCFKNISRVHENCFISLICCGFAFSNFQVVNHFILTLKNYQDIANSLIWGLGLALTLNILRINNLEKISKEWPERIHNIIMIFLLLYIAKLVLLSQGFDFSNLRYNINVGPQLSSKQVERIKHDPLHAIILDARLSQSIPYSAAKMLAPVFAYHYNFSNILKQCEYTLALSKNALHFLEQNYGIGSPEYQAIKPRADFFFQEAKKYDITEFKNRDYCDKALFTDNNFYVIYPDTSQKIYHFPNWTLPDWGTDTYIHHKVHKIVRHTVRAIKKPLK